MQLNSGGRITLGTAADLAATLTIGLLSPIYSQIDPMHVGEACRASSIAQQYGTRLNEVAKNLRGPEALEFLIGGYSNHGFVIDRREAAKLFNRVRTPTETESELIDALGDLAYKPISGGPPRIEFISDSIGNDKEKANEHITGAPATPTGKPRKTSATSGRSGKANGSDTGGLHV